MFSSLNIIHITAFFSHAVLGKPPSHPSTHKAPQTNNPQAWRTNSSAMSTDPSPRMGGASGLSGGGGGASSLGRYPLPPLSDVSDGAHTVESQRTARSKKEKEEKIAEDW